MVAADYDITIEQGTDSTISMILKDDSGALLDLAGYTARMQIRPNISSDTKLDELTTENSRITITVLTAKVTLSFPNSVTTLYSFINGVYDLELISGGLVTRILEGKVTVSKEVTRS